MLIDLFTVFREEADANGIVFYYSGILSQNVITTMSDSLKQKLQIQDEKGARSRKVFSTFIEMVQNAMHYSPDMPGSDNANKEGSIIVGKKEDRYFVICANFIQKQHEARIRDKIDPILEMSADEIRQAYRTQLKNDQHSDDTISKGAGLGFLTLARDSVEPIQYAIREAIGYENELSCFYLKATI